MKFKTLLILPLLVASLQAASVSISRPLDGDSVIAGNSVEILVDAFNLDGFITQVNIYEGNTLLGQAYSSGRFNEYRYNLLTDISNVGVLGLEARATDELGNVVSSGVVNLTVSPGSPPQADIYVNSSGYDSCILGETITVEIVASDSDGYVTTVEVYNGSVLLGTATRTSPTVFLYQFSTSSVGKINLQARVTDDSGNTSITNIQTIRVDTGSFPAVSIDNPLNGEVFFINTLIPLAITANDGDDSIVSVEVFSNDSSVGFASSLGGNQYEFVLTETGDAGLQRLTAVATDELGNRTTSSEVNILLSSGVSPVTVINKVNGVAPAVAPAVDVVDLGSLVTLGISASDIDGNVTQVEVFNGSNSIGLASLVGVDTYRFDYQASSPGQLNLQVRSTDDLGNIGFSDLVPVSVITGAIPAVSITSPTDGNSIKSGETLEITVTATDAEFDGFITSVEVFNNAVSLGLANPTGNASEYLLSIPTSATNVGNLNLQARAVDNQGNVGYSAVIGYSVFQGAVPAVSITSPGNGEVFFINTQIPLAITAADVDDSIVSVEVFNNGTLVGLASLVNAVTGAYEFTHTDTQNPGLQRLTAAATDELGNVGISNIETITVLPQYLSETLDSDGDGIVDSDDMFPYIPTQDVVNEITNNPSLYDLYSKENFQDLRTNSTILDVSNNQATIQIQMEESSDLQSWEDAGDPATMTIPADTDTKFFRFKMAD